MFIRDTEHIIEENGQLKISMDIFENIVICAGTENVLKKSDGFKETDYVMSLILQ